MPFSAKEGKLVDRLYKETGGNAAAITRGLNKLGIDIGVDMVRIYLRSEGYELQHGGRRVSEKGRGALNKKEIADVLKAYKRYKGCAACAERGSNYRYSRGTYRRYWEDAGFSASRKPHSPGELEIILGTKKL